MIIKNEFSAEGCKGGDNAYGFEDTGSFSLVVASCRLVLHPLSSGNLCVLEWSNGLQGAILTPLGDRTTICMGIPSSNGIIARIGACHIRRGFAIESWKGSF